MPRQTVSVAPFREAFEKSDISSAELARRLGFMRTVPDSTRARRQLGLLNCPHYDGTRRPREFITLETAEALVDALGVDPVDVGI